MENDRLSELPDCLIFKIFPHLSFKEVVRTSILSKRWQNLWSRCPDLNFEYMRFELDANEVQKIVNRGLMMWRGERIQRFAIGLENVRDEWNLYGDIDLWLRYAREYQVQELYVCMRYDEEGKEPYWVPRGLYSSSSLRLLSLIGCNLQIPMHVTSVKWNELLYLTIGCYEVSEVLIDRVLLGCPRLQGLVLHVHRADDNLCIRSTSLEMLWIDRYMPSDRSIEAKAELRISTTNLERLHLSGAPCAKCSINAPSLTLANLIFDTKTLNGYGKDLLLQTLEQILPGIQNARKLGLSDCCIKVLGCMKNMCMVRPFPNVSELRIVHCSLHYEEILTLLDILPELKVILFEDEYSHGLERLVVKEGMTKEFKEAVQPNIHLYSFVQELITILKRQV